MTLAEKMANIITENVISLKTYIEAQKIKEIPEDDIGTAVSVVYDDIKELIRSRTQEDNWLDFLRFYYKSAKSEAENKENVTLYKVAAKSWEEGYICGFADREKMLINKNIDDETDDKIKEHIMKMGVDYDDTLTGRSEKNKPCQRANADKASR